MRLFDLRLRGSGFTLGEIVGSEDHMNFRALIGYLQFGANEEDELPQSFKFEKKEVKGNSFEEKYFLTLIAWTVEQGYCTLQGDVLTFTRKAMSVFEKMIEKDNKLSETGFSCRPCFR